MTARISLKSSALSIAVLLCLVAWPCATDGERSTLLSERLPGQPPPPRSRVAPVDLPRWTAARAEDTLGD